MSEQSLLLDTCAIIFSSEDAFLAAEVASQINIASTNGQLFVSPISSWEIGKSVAGGRLVLAADPLNFFLRFLERTSANLCDMGPDVLVASSFLPGRIHKDPFDRILIETARRENLTLVTSDRAILAYGALGHVKTLAC
jgi:PIN domain nuclease of toxin-antitoxin system